MYADGVNLAPSKALNPSGALPSNTTAESEQEQNTSSPNFFRDSGKETSVNPVLAKALSPIVFIVCGSCIFTNSL